jgi:hypothetical protein
MFKRTADVSCSLKESIDELVTSMIDTLGWPTLAECRLKARLIMLFKITHALIAIPNIILIPTDSRTRKSHNQTFRYITDTKKIHTNGHFSR